MTEENIRKMVEKYEIKDNRDGRIRAYHVKTDEEKNRLVSIRLKSWRI